MYRNFRAKLQYRIMIDLHVPELEANRQLGMFTLTVAYLTENDQIVSTSSRPARLYYRSKELQFMRMAAFSLLFLSGWMSESQILSIEMEDLIMHHAKVHCITVKIYKKSFKIILLT
jgi:hypothetical protein